MLPTSDEIWGLYRQAVLEALHLPPTDPLMIASNGVPLFLYTDTEPVVPSVPQEVALSQLFRFGNVLPAWSPAYRPTADGDLVGVYREFVESLKKKNDPAVRRARDVLDRLDGELAAGHGHLVMTLATDAGTATVPRFDPSPLGNPGFSRWLEIAIQTYGKLPPEVDVTVSSASLPSRGSAPFGPISKARLQAFVEFLGRGAPPVQELRLTIHSVTTVALSQAEWFEPVLLGLFTQPSDFNKGTVFAERPIWGPLGTFNLIPTMLVAGFRPTVEVTFDGAPSTEAESRLRCGPFLLVPADDQDGLEPDQRRYWDSSIGPLLVGVACQRPNYTPS